MEDALANNALLFPQEMQPLFSKMARVFFVLDCMYGIAAAQFQEKSHRRLSS